MLEFCQAIRDTYGAIRYPLQATLNHRRQRFSSVEEGHRPVFPGHPSFHGRTAAPQGCSHKFAEPSKQASSNRLAFSEMRSAGRCIPSRLCASCAVGFPFLNKGRVYPQQILLFYGEKAFRRTHCDKVAKESHPICQNQLRQAATSVVTSKEQRRPMIATKLM